MKPAGRPLGYYVNTSIETAHHLEETLRPLTPQQKLQLVVWLVEQVEGSMRPIAYIDGNPVFRQQKGEG